MSGVIKRIDIEIRKLKIKLTDARDRLNAATDRNHVHDQIRVATEITILASELAAHQNLKTILSKTEES